VPDALKKVEEAKPDWADNAPFDKRPEVIFLRALRGDDKKKPVELVGEALDTAIKSLADEQQQRFDFAFDEVLKGTRPGKGGSPEKVPPEASKRAAAKLLLALADEIAPPPGEGQESPALARALNVIGLSAAADEARRQAAMLDEALTYQNVEANRERLAFAA